MKLSGIINKVNNNHRRKGNSIMRNRYPYVNLLKIILGGINLIIWIMLVEFANYNNRFNINSNSIIYRNQIMPNNNINFEIDED